MYNENLGATHVSTCNYISFSFLDANECIENIDINEDQVQDNGSMQKGSYSKLTEEQRESRRAYNRDYYRRKCALRDSQDSLGGAGIVDILIILRFLIVLAYFFDKLYIVRACLFPADVYFLIFLTSDGSSACNF